MSSFPGQSWSDNPNAPQISSELYLFEKGTFAGFFIATILYGIAMALCFQCMGVLLSPTNPLKRRTKWALVVHTVATFSLLTMAMGIFRSKLSISYIDNREFPSNYEGVPGPLGYEDTFTTEASDIFGIFTVPLNQWLVDGLLLHRCYVIYSMNYWAIAFPCLMYLASVAFGITSIYEGTQRTNYIAWIGSTTSYSSISLSLNIILTLMIITRLILHRRNVQKAIGASDAASGLYAAIVVMLIESYALYAVALLLFIVPWATDSWVTNIFSKSTGAIQVIAQYLIVLRVAERRALTGKSVSGTIESIRFRSQRTTDSDGSLPDGYLVNSMEVNGEARDELGAGADDAVEEVPL